MILILIKIIKINKTITVGINNKHYISTPKTESYNKAINIDYETSSILSKWKQLQQIKSIDKNIFTYIKSRYITLSISGRVLDRVIDYYNLNKVDVHSLRHIHCSLLFNSDAELKYLLERLGHSNIQTTLNIYTLITKSESKKSIDIFAKICLIEFFPSPKHTLLINQDL